jgi:hypothetical protein
MLSANRALFVAPNAMSLRHARSTICPGERQGALGLVSLEFAQPEFATYPQQVFTAVNFAVLPFWGMMIAAPKVGTIRCAAMSPCMCWIHVIYQVPYIPATHSAQAMHLKHDISVQYTLELSGRSAAYPEKQLEHDISMQYSGIIRQIRYVS